MNMVTPFASRYKGTGVVSSSDMCFPNARRVSSKYPRQSRAIALFVQG
jgi:hypothetical protein